MINKTKVLSLFAFALLAVVVVASFGSAASLSIDNIVLPEGYLKHDAGSFKIDFDLTNTGVADDDVSFTLVMANGVAEMDMESISIGEDFVNGVTVPLTATIDYDSYQSGKLIGKVVVDDGGSGTPKELSFSLKIENEEGLSLDLSGDVLEVTNIGNVDLDDVELTAEEEGDFPVTFSEDVFDLNAGESFDAHLTADLTDLKFGDNAVVITATSGDVTESIDYVKAGAFCEAGEQGGMLSIEDFEISNKGQGDDDEWDLLDIIEVEVNVENTDSSEDVKDVMVELAIIDSDGKDVTNDFDFENADEEEYDLGKLRDGDDEDIVFRFKVPADVDEGSYKIVVKAYQDKNENIECTDDIDGSAFEEIDINKKDDEGEFIAFDNIIVSPEQVTCGESVTLVAEVYNVGDEELENRIRVNLYNSAMGLDEYFEIMGDFKEGDDDTVSFEFVVPSGLEDGVYDLKLSADYDYKSGNYRYSSDEEKRYPLTIVGCGGSGGSFGGNDFVLISADTDSDAEPGKELVVTTTVTNLLDSEETYVFDVSDYDDWASLEDVSDRVVTLGSGESVDVEVTFMIDEDAEGDESFTIRVTNSGSGESERKDVELSIEGTGGSSRGFTGFASFGEGSGMIWVIGLVNLVLIILIIIVAVRVSRR